MLQIKVPRSTPSNVKDREIFNETRMQYLSLHHRKKISSTAQLPPIHVYRKAKLDNGDVLERMQNHVILVVGGTD